MAAPGSLLQAALAVNRVRIAAGRGTRADAQGWLDSVPLERLGLGPEDVLHVPRLGLRFPARGQGPAVAGERILRSLRTLLESADRDPPPGSAPGLAFRFSSRARYLAWVTGLWLAGGASGRSAAAEAAIGPDLEGLSLAEWQRREILAEGLRLVPVAAHLAQAGMAAAWATGLAPPDRAQAKAAIAQRFGLDLAALPPPRHTLAGKPADPADPGGGARRPGIAPPPGPPLPRSIARAAAILARDGAWRALDEEARRILLAACALAASPSDSSRPGFADALRSAARSRGGPCAPAFSSTAGEIGAARAVTPPDPPPGRLRAARGRGETAEARAFRVEAVGHPPDARSARTCGASSQSALRAETETGGEAFSGRWAESSALSPAAIRFTSRYAGLLFLLNAFVALGLYPDFTEPGGGRLAPSPLWLADRIGRTRFGGPYRADPLARWISAGAMHGPLPRRWRADEDWLGGFRDRPRPVWSHKGGRATLWHPAGFPLVDAPEHARLRSRHRLGRESPARSRLPGAPDARWIACLRLYLEARIRLATGDARGLALLALPGEILVDELDLTAVFRLDAHPIGLRLAGLDRDLGWQPAEGRSIRFRFE